MLSLRGRDSPFTNSKNSELPQPPHRRLLVTEVKHEPMPTLAA